MVVHAWGFSTLGTPGGGVALEFLTEMIMGFCRSESIVGTW
jgi:hypothetical protein